MQKVDLTDLQVIEESVDNTGGWCGFGWDGSQGIKCGIFCS